VGKAKTIQGQNIGVSLPSCVCSLIMCMVALFGTAGNSWDQGYFNSVVEQWHDNVVVELTVQTAECTAKDTEEVETLFAGQWWKSSGKKKTTTTLLYPKELIKLDG